MGRTELFSSLARAFRKNGSSNSGTSRRDFLLRSLSVGALTAGWPASALIHRPSAKANDGVVIVGAGVAGLTVAYRLSHAGIGSQIFEGSGRIGGRMYTESPFNSDGMFVELGGELVDTGHTDLQALCAELSIPLQPFALEDSGLEHALYFSGGKNRSEAEVIQAFGPLAQILQNDVASISTDGQLVVPTYRSSGAAKKLDETSLEQYLYSMRGKVDRWLLDLLDVAYVDEYGLETSEQSALNLLVLIGLDVSAGFKIFGDSDEAMRIEGGSERLPRTLSKVLGKASTPIHLGHRLVAIRDKHTSFRLFFENDGGTTREVRAQRVILAVPFSVLRKVDGIASLDLTAVKRTAIEKMGYGTNAKVMLGFMSRFWRKSPPQGLPASTGIMYTDWGSQAFWETSRLQPGTSGILTCYLGGRAGQNVSEARATAILSDLGQWFPEASAEFDGNVRSACWRRSPYQRGSYVCLKPGQYTSLNGSAGEPELKGRLFFAGEHCSVDFQGYMNGAIQSANATAFQVIQSGSGGAFRLATAS